MSESRGLGKGLDALIPTEIDEFVAETLPEELKTSGNEVVELDVTQISPNPHQPRGEFVAEELTELADSIKAHGIFQPLIVIKTDDGFQLVAGERRLRAAKQVGLKTVPVIVRSFSQQEQLEVAVIENIQRAELKPLEVAIAYIKLGDQFNLTHNQIAARLGKGSSTVSNTIRLVNLPHKAKLSLQNGEISEGHARAILSVQGEPGQLELLKLIVSGNLTVREAEEAARRMKAGDKQTKAASATKIRAEFNTLTNNLGKHLGTKVAVQKTAKGGKLLIEYYSDEELERIAEQILGDQN